MKLKHIIFAFSLLTLSFSCEKFEEMNENPNEPAEVSTNVLLPSAIRQSVNTLVTESFLLGNNIAQLTAKTLRTEVDDYRWNAFPTVWEGFYKGLTDIVVIEQKAVEDGNEVLEGAVIVLKSWIFSNLTNSYGDIPYTNAINGFDSDFTPEYDLQEDIYADLLDELSRANTLLASGNGMIGSGDILLGGDANHWIRFCNSLRLRLLMTANNQIPDAGTQFARIVAEEEIITSNSENVILNYLTSFPNQFPTVPLKTGDFDAVALSSTLLGVMDEHKDPRLSRYARPDNDDYNNPTFTGADNGVGESCATSGSRLGAQFFDDPNQTSAIELGLEDPDGIIITYAEVEFLLAEAADKGWIGDSVEPHYRKGIKASMDYYRVNYQAYGWEDFNEFYNQPSLTYVNRSDIWEQKWQSLYFHGLEPYFELRRWYFESGMSFDGIPFIDAACENNNNNELPLRFLYPGEEQSLNEAAYQTAIERLDGGNSFNARIWLVE